MKKSQQKIQQFPYPILNERPEEMDYETYREILKMQKHALRKRIKGAFTPVYTKKQLQIIQALESKQNEQGKETTEKSTDGLQ